MQLTSVLTFLETYKHFLPNHQYSYINFLSNFYNILLFSTKWKKSNDMSFSGLFADTGNHGTTPFQDKYIFHDFGGTLGTEQT